ncbi:MAG TPA: ABC transporter ATP-binding protein [Desulfobacterales bacterium]|nr:ABC transporter ATP-binding protein [Desulfobacterales bacterium]
MKQTKRKSGLPRLLEIAGAKKWWLIGSMALAVLSAFALFTPYVAVYRILTELALHADAPAVINRDFIWRWGFISLGGVCAFGVLFYISNMLSHIAAFNILYELRVALAGKLARLPLGYFDKRASGDIKKVMSEDVERVELFVAHHIPDATTAVVFPLIILGFLFAVDWRPSLVILLVFLGAVLIQSSIYYGPRSKAVYENYLKSLGRMNASIVEYVRGIQVVKIFSRSVEPFERLRGAILSYRDYALNITRKFALTYTGFLTMLSSTILFLTPVIIFLLLKAPSYSAFMPTAFLFLIFGGGMFFPLLKLMHIGGLLKQNSIGVGLIDDILHKQEMTEPEDPRQPAGASVEFRNVTFAYDEETVLKGISFLAEPGSITALVGPSGAGKTTVGLLTARFWDVNSGEILIGGVPIRQIRTEELMRLVAFVFQDNMLFFDTIEENIRMGNDTASREEVMEAARAAQCHEFIEQLEKGYDTLVGEGGTYLSGGEQQRLALARAILKNAPIVVLDEATAFADPENEGKILASFSRLIRGKTVLVIAHRLSTITGADRILVIDAGIIAEQGRHEELLSLEGLYARMWRTYTQSRQWVLGSMTDR